MGKVTGNKRAGVQFQQKRVSYLFHSAIKNWNWI